MEEASPCCSLTVRCDTLFDNMDRLDAEKAELIPEDGVLFSVAEVAFTPGESVFDILNRELRNHQVHLEYTRTPLYDSAYIEGIANLYEFDCGELSGWVYTVNSLFPPYGCSLHFPKDGDEIVFLYTCDLGADVGGNNLPGGAS